MENILSNNKLVAFSILVTLFIIVSFISLPFLTAFFGGLIMFVLLLPLKRKLIKNSSEYFSAWVCTLISLSLLLIPPAVFAIVFGKGILTIKDRIISLNIFGKTVSETIPFISSELTWGEVLQNTIPRLIEPIESALSNIIHIIIVLFIMHVLLFYLLLNEKRFFSSLKKGLPFSRKNNEFIIKKFYDITYATIIGGVIIAIVQGGLTTIAFIITGLPGAIFWGIVTAIISLIPILGSPLIWGPAALYLAFTEKISGAIIMLIFGIIIATSDNVIRPIINKKFGEVHPVITIIGVFAGIYQFGFIGIFIGPLLIAYFVLIWKIYKKEYMER